MIVVCSSAPGPVQRGAALPGVRGHGERACVYRHVERERGQTFPLHRLQAPVHERLAARRPPANLRLQTR